MTDSDDLLSTLQKLEVELHDPSALFSERAAQLLAESFVEFGSSGHIYSRAEVLLLLACKAPRQFPLRNFLCSVLHKMRHYLPTSHVIRVLPRFRGQLS
jgi:hypothetical protein